MHALSVEATDTQTWDLFIDSSKSLKIIKLDGNISILLFEFPKYHQS